MQSPRNLAYTFLENPVLLAKSGIPSGATEFNTGKGKKVSKNQKSSSQAMCLSLLLVSIPGHPVLHGGSCRISNPKGPFMEWTKPYFVIFISGGSRGQDGKHDGTRGHCLISNMYKGLVIYDVKGSVHVLFRKLHHIGERGRKGRECKCPNKAH